MVLASFLIDASFDFTMLLFRKVPTCRPLIRLRRGSSSVSAPQESTSGLSIGMYQEEEMTVVTESDPLVSPKSSVTTSSDQKKKMSVQEILDKAKFSGVDLMFLISLGLIAIADSMQACYIAIVLPVLRCDWLLSAAEVAVVTSLTFTGTGLGGIFIGPLSDSYGRKPTAMITSLVLFVSMVVTAFASDVVFFLVFGIISGVCVGGSLSIAYTYWAEVSSQVHRAAGVVVITMFWNTGMTLSNGLAYLVLNRVGWRLYTIMMSLPALAAYCILFFLPESPKFLNRDRQNPDRLVKALRAKLDASGTNLNLEEITISEEPEAETDPRLNTGHTILRSFGTICSGKLRGNTFKMLASYSCLQILYKGLLYVVTTMLAHNYCGLKMGDQLIPRSDDDSYNCATLSNGDLLSGVLLSIAFFPSTVSSVYATKKFGENRALQMFAVCCFVFTAVLLACIPVTLIFLNLGLLVFSVSAMSLVFYVILPKMYPTVARNSGFGLVDGVGKLVASVGVFAITSAMVYSIRIALGILVLVCVAINIQVFVFKLGKPPNYDGDDVRTRRSDETLPYKE